jgi:GT2 family glycosyltransferase
LQGSLRRSKCNNQASEMKMHYPKVAIVILTWNGLGDAIECLDSLRKITYPNYEVVVVDNASTGDDVRVLREKFGNYIHIIQNDKNYGFAKGNNIGLRYALARDSAYVLLLNDDTVVAPDFLNEMVQVAECDRKIGIVCPMIYWYDEPQEIWYGKIMKVDLYRGICIEKPIKSQDESVITSGFATGAAMLIKRETTEKIGLLPEDYFFGVEDFDYSIHTLKAGFTIAIAARAWVWHKGSKSITVAGIGYHYRYWQIMRRKYLSTPAYEISTISALMWAVWRSVIPFMLYVRRGNFRELRNFFSKVIQAVKGTIEGLKYRRNNR